MVLILKPPQRACRECRVSSRIDYPNFDDA
jgi:hypothetical protein